MGKKANPAVIGGFVVGAAALLVVGVLVFGSGKFWKTTRPWVSYFPGSVKGLQIGAPVTFRGVKIGQVTIIKAVLNVREEPLTILTPVYWEFETDTVETVGISRAELNKMQAAGRPVSQLLIKRGLRAQLQLQSFVTGQKFIQLDFHPDSPIRLVGVDTDVPEYPTVESGMEKLTASIQELPLREIGDAALSLIRHADQLVNSPEVKAVLRSANETLKTYDKVGRDINEQVLPPTSKLIKDINTQIIPQTSKLVRDLDSQVTPAARDALKEAEATLATYRGLLAEGSPVRYELVKLLSEGAAAARSLRVLADYLERHPEALLAGKGGPGGRR
ncbi:MAG: MlaD family protein [candidate division NC10 bacterium]|nr:MlaD family protein [candidate division NC10 bacterium]